MRKKKELPKISNFLYLGIFILILKTYGAASSIIPFYNELLDTCLSLFGCLCLVLHCILKRYYDIKIFFIYIVVGCLALYSVVVVDNYNILITVVTCFAIRGEKTSDVIEFVFKWEVILFLLHLTYALLRIPLTGENYLQIISGVSRYDMGFGHPNRFSILVFNLLIMWIWLNFSTIKFKNIIVIFLISIVNYMITRTRTNEVAITMLLVILFCWKINSKTMSSWLKNVAMLIVPILELCSVGVVILYSHGTNAVLDMLDIILSGRIRLGAYAYEHYGITFLGQQILSSKVTYDSVYRLNYFTFDNIYTDITMQQGLIWVIILAVLFFLIAIKRNDANNFAIIAWGVYGITEVHGLNVYMLFVVLLVNELFFKKSSISKI